MTERNKKRIKLYNKHKYQRDDLLFKLSQEKTFDTRLNIQKFFEKLPRNSSKIRIRNRCWKTGRARGFYRDFGLCRHVLRKMIHQGLIPGLMKASW